MSAHRFRPTLEVLEERRTPSSLFFTAGLGGGHAAVSLQIDVQYPPNPVAPEIVAVSRVLPNGVIHEYPPTPIFPPNPIFPPSPVHALYPPSPVRGLLQAADVSSIVFLPPTTTGNGGVT